MNSILEYKGYHTRVEFDSEDKVLRGKIEGINDLVNFECEDIKGVEAAFHEAVDEYLEFCKEVGKEPDKEYRGSFNIRIAPELHKKLSVVSLKNGDSLNSSVEKAIKEYVSDRTDVIANKVLSSVIVTLAEETKTESLYYYNEESNNIGGDIFSYCDFKMNYGEELKKNDF